MANFRLAIFVLVTFAALAGTEEPAAALPVFAHRFGFSCEVCHTTVPHLNAFGESFRENGFSVTGEAGRQAFPIAAKFNLAYSTTADPSGLPKAMLDELELLTGGHAGKNASYFVEQYVVDGGRPGETRDAWLAVKNAVTLKLGQFSLPLPVDVEDERDTLAHYAVFDQTIGANPFALFDPQLGADVSIGSDDGAALHVAALDGHDPQSGLPRDGLDRMVYAQFPARGLVLSAYRYDGARPLVPFEDRFWRRGFALGNASGKLRLDALIQRGWDGSFNGTGGGAASSAGYAQVRWEFSPRLCAVARYDGTHDDQSGMRRALIASIVGRPARNMRLTVEGQFTPGSSSVGSALLFAY